MTTVWHLDVQHLQANRDNAVLNESALEELCERCPNPVAVKDVRLTTGKSVQFSM
jgi:phosphoribosylamine-glycine ligase